MTAPRATAEHVRNHDRHRRLAEYITENPFKGLGAVVAASVAKDMAAAGIGAATKTALEKGMSAALSSGLGGPAAIGVIAVALAAAMKEAIDLDVASKSKSMTDAVVGGVDATNATTELMAKMRSGKLSQGDLAEAQKAMKDAQASVAKQQAEIAAGPGFLQRTVGFFAEHGENTPQQRADWAASQAAEAAAKQQTLKRTQQAERELAATIARATESIAKLSSAADKVNPNAPHLNLPMSAGPRGGT